MYLAEQLYGTLFVGKSNLVLSSTFHQCLLLPGRLGFSRSCANLQSRVLCGGEGGAGCAGRCCLGLWLSAAQRLKHPVCAVCVSGHSEVLQLCMGHMYLMGMVCKCAF